MNQIFEDKKFLNIWSIDDPKVNMGRHDKNLCRMQTQIATKAEESKETYKIVVSEFNNILEDVDAYVSNQGTKSSTHSR